MISLKKDTILLIAEHSSNPQEAEVIANPKRWMLTNTPIRYRSMQRIPWSRDTDTYLIPLNSPEVRV